MENDQIKSQIENAKKAFVANKERSREAGAVELDTTDQQGQEKITPQDSQLQEDIMSRVRELMVEATHTNKGPAASSFTSNSPVAENRARPFWAQNRVDIPPSEQFGKRQKMQEQNDSGRESQLGTPAQSTSKDTDPSTGLPTSDLLTAIRQEVFNKLEDGTGQAEELQRLENRLQQLESRADKQQQDLTALLKLVRQLANREAKMEEEKAQPHRNRSLFGALIFVLLLILVGSASWLYWMNPELMINLSANVLNQGFDFALNLISRAGLL